MLFHKPLVSLIAAVAVASSVAASATPVRRTNPPPIPPQDCDTNDLTCCDSSSEFGNAPGLIQSLLHTLDDLLLIDLDTNLLVGLGCTLTGTLLCGTQQAVCCDSVLNQIGLVNVGLNCVPIAL